MIPLAPIDPGAAFAAADPTAGRVAALARTPPGAARREAANEIQVMFLTQLIRTLRATVPESDFLPRSPSRDIYDGVFDRAEATTDPPGLVWQIGGEGDAQDSDTPSRYSHGTAEGSRATNVNDRKGMGNPHVVGPSGVRPDGLITPPAPPTGDQVSVSEAARELARLRAEVGDVGFVDRRKVENLASVVAKGQYTVDLREVARRLLRELIGDVLG